MTATKKILFQLALAPLFICNVVAQEMELRVLPSGQNTLRWEFTNASPFSIGTPRDFFGGDNNFIAARPKRSASGWSEEMVFGPVYDREATPPPIIIPPEAGRIEYVDKMTFPGLIAFFMLTIICAAAGGCATSLRSILFSDALRMAVP